MSHLVLQQGIPDFDRAVISFWFIAPTESIRKVAEHAETATGDTLMRDILPLVTFGKRFTGYKTDIATTEAMFTEQNYDYINSYQALGLPTQHPYTADRNVIKTETDVPIDRSYIGLVCKFDSDTGEL